jgi:hypothetical protein
LDEIGRWEEAPPPSKFASQYSAMATAIASATYDQLTAPNGEERVLAALRDKGPPS